MKKFILFLLLIAAISVRAQKYVPFPTENAEWNIEYSYGEEGFPPNEILLSYSLKGDTIINSKSYHILLSKYQNRIKGGIREDNKRIYYLDFSYSGGYLSLIKPTISPVKECAKSQIKSLNGEFLLYDFNKTKSGDTLFVYPWGTPALITKIDSIQIQGSFRKRYEYNSIFHGIDYVIEGVGSIKEGLLGGITDLPMCGNHFWNFISFQKNNQTVYKNPSYKEANSVTRWDDYNYLKTGTQWYYGETIYPIYGTNSYSNFDYNSVKSVGDTTINNQLCQKLNHVRNRPTCYGYEQQVYVYQSNDTVYFQNSNTKKFSTLYVYGANQGDSWTVNYPQGAVKVQVDSISTLWAMGQWLKIQYVTNSTPIPNSGPAIFKFSSKIIEGIGDENYYFNSFIFYRPVCDDFSWSPDCLRCYINPDLGTYHVPGTLDCAYVTEISKQNYNTLKVNLNSSGILSVEGDLSTTSCVFELLDLKGSVMLRTTVTTSENTLNLSQYDKGMYLYRISANGALLKAGKIVKQ